MRPGQYITFDKGLLGLVHLKHWEVSECKSPVYLLDSLECTLKLCLEKVRVPSKLYSQCDFSSILKSCSIFHTNYEVYLVSNKEGDQISYDLSEPIIIDYISSRGYHMKVAEKSFIIGSLLLEMLTQSNASMAKL